MFKNIFYDTRKSTIHLWEQIDGRNTHNSIYWVPYAFREDKDGTYKTIDGKQARKIKFDTFNSYWITTKDNDEIYENAVRPEIQFLTDKYHGIADDEIQAPKLRTFYIDIEVHKDFGFPSVVKAEDPVVVVSVYDDLKKNTTTFGLHPYSGNAGDFTYIHCKNEKTLLINLFNFFKENPYDVLSGWYCLDKDEYVFLDNRIVKLENTKVGDKVGSYGNILKKVYTGTKDAYKIVTPFGNIKCSGDHIFPACLKPKNSYRNKNTLIQKSLDISVKDIIEGRNENDVYLRLDKCINTNNTLTYRKLLKNSIDEIVERDLDFILGSNARRFLIENYYGLVKSRVYNGLNKRYHNTTPRWKYSNFRHVIEKHTILKDIENGRFFEIVSKKKRKRIILDNIISNDDLYLLGLIYTDGHIYKEEIVIDNTDRGIIIGAMSIINTLRKSKYSNIDNIKTDNRHKERLISYRLIAPHLNQFKILSRLIYKSNVKNIFVEGLSQLSYDQFLHFYSGMIDGDGSMLSTGCTLANFNEDAKKIQQVLLFNGVLASVNRAGTRLYITPMYKNNYNFLSGLHLRHTTKSKRVYTLKSRKYASSNNIKFIEYDNFFLVKVYDIEKTGKSDMIDIETTSHYFLCNGIQTHNCLDFDLPYLINRTKVLFGENNSVFTNLSPINVVRTWSEKDDKLKIDIAGVSILDYIDIYKWYSPHKLERHSLDFVSKFELGEGKIDYSEYGNLRDLYNKNWDLYVEYNMVDAQRVGQLEEKLGYIKLVQALSLLCKAPMKNYYAMTQLIEGLMLTYFRRNGLCAPHFWGGTQETFEAAYVKEPIKGFYDWVIDLDITSSYPSHIITLNMSPETYYGRILGMTEVETMKYTSERRFPEFSIIRNSNISKVRGKKLGMFNTALERKLFSVAPCGSIFSTSIPGIFSTVERNIFEKRKDIKSKIFKLKKSLPELKGDDYHRINDRTTQLTALQQALKIILNALFGVTSVPYSRYFNSNISEAITSCGRQTIKAGEKITNRILNNPNEEIKALLEEIKGKANV